MKKKVPAPKMWTKAEAESVKVSVAVSYKRGKVWLHCKPTIIRPTRMSETHRNQLNNLIKLYGTKR